MRQNSIAQFKFFLDLVILRFIFRNFRDPRKITRLLFVFGHYFVHRYSLIFFGFWNFSMFVFSFQYIFKSFVIMVHDMIIFMSLFLHMIYKYFLKKSHPNVALNKKIDRIHIFSAI